MADPNAYRKTLLVEAPQQVAFDVFAQKMSRWWPLETHKIGATVAKEVIVEPRAGGRWFERDADGSECDWGRVLTWEPPARLVLAWQLDADFKFDPKFQTEVEVRFVAEGPSRTRVEFEHRNLDRYGAKAEAVRRSIGSPEGWPAILDLYLEATRK